MNIHLSLDKVFTLPRKNSNMSDKKDSSGADLPLESKITDTEYFMESHAEKIVDFMEKKIVEDFAPTHEIYDGLLNQLVNEFPFGKLEGGGFYYDKVHAILANTLMGSFWCGWVAKAMANRKEPKFNPAYLEKFRRIISKAYEGGWRYASQRP
jgi:hypothetical protein